MDRRRFWILRWGKSNSSSANHVVIQEVGSSLVAKAQIELSDLLLVLVGNFNDHDALASISFLM